MRCPNCGEKINSNDTICSICGTYVSHDEWDDTPNQINPNNKEIIYEQDVVRNDYNNQLFRVRDTSGTSKNDFYYQNEEYLESYIGEDYKLTKKSFINIWAFLFHWVYFLYRKLYITGIIGLGIDWLAIYLWKNNLVVLGIYYLVTSILLGVLFRIYYLAIARRRVDRIVKREKEDGDTDKFTILKICHDKGGVLVVPALLIYLVFLVIVFFTIIRIQVNEDYNPKFFEENSENKANCISISKVAYKDVKDQKIGELKEAVCRVKPAKVKQYELYYKTETEDRVIYSYYITEDGYLKFKNNTKDIESLRNKKDSGNISEEEDLLLAEMEMSIVNYNEYYKKSKSEDRAIEEKANESEKLNYIISKDEILR